MFFLFTSNYYMYTVCSNSNILESSFNNAFYSSALREWQEHVALGHFTPEYKAKIRGEEKRRMVRAEDLWKKKFYEETWGDKWDIILSAIHHYCSVLSTWTRTCMYVYPNCLASPFWANFQTANVSH